MCRARVEHGVGLAVMKPYEASACTVCGVRVERCPFEVDVVARMRQAVQSFETP